MTLQVSYGDRIALVGPNGAGKTTLLHALLGRLPLTSGRAALGSGVLVGEVDQARARFHRDVTVVAVAGGGHRVAGLAVQDAARQVRAPGRPRARPASSLSPGSGPAPPGAAAGGRGEPASSSTSRPTTSTCPAIEQLEAALEAYDGTLLLVTHDRRLLEAVRP